MQQSCIPLRNLRNLRENKHISVLYQSAQMKPQCIPLISQIYADKTQNNKTAITTTTSLSVFLCVIMQLAAFLCVICVICGRIFTQEYSIYIAQMKPQCLPQISLIIADKQQNRNNLTLSVFLCVIMQLAAFLCVICVICGRIFTQEYSIYVIHINPNISPADLAD